MVPGKVFEFNWLSGRFWYMHQSRKVRWRQCLKVCSLSRAIFSITAGAGGSPTEVSLYMMMGAQEIIFAAERRDAQPRAGFQWNRRQSVSLGIHVVALFPLLYRPAISCSPHLVPPCAPGAPSTNHT